MITTYQVALKLNITDTRVLKRAGELLQQADKANNVKREKISQVEGTRTYMVNSYPDDMESEITDDLIRAGFQIEYEKAQRIKAEEEAERMKMLIEEMPVEIIAKKRILRPRIKKPFKQ